ncbi:hypothetical protein LG58_941 [Kosakonia radicincitans YD4]|nr:hypothetical protein LG58_941 [Kosakonia radicincitans YD4]
MKSEAIDFCASSTFLSDLAIKLIRAQAAGQQGNLYRVHFDHPVL